MVCWNSIALAAIMAVTSSGVLGFAPSHPISHPASARTPHFPIRSTTQRYETTDNNTSQESANSKCRIPLSLDELIADASRTMNEAYEAGVTRQTVRVLLPRDSKNAQLGQYIEEDASLESGTFGGSDMVLVPPDETWQGGIMQLYRAAAPTCREILR